MIFLAWRTSLSICCSMPLKSTHRRMSTPSLWSVCPVHEPHAWFSKGWAVLLLFMVQNAFCASHSRQFMHELQSENGGSTNAYTSSESTNYHFDVNQEHLEGALDRFAQFFISPTISQDGVEREVNAVDSE